MALMTDITSLLRQRWSPKQFDPDHIVTEDMVRLLLEAARWAPSARNRQPWHFLIGRRGDALRARIEGFVAGYSDWALDAGLLVVNVYESRYPEHDLALYDLGGAVAHMSVQGEALGLHARQFATFDRAGLSRAFDIAAPFTAVTMTAFGVAAVGSRPDERTRRSLADLTWPTS